MYGTPNDVAAKARDFLNPAFLIIPSVERAYATLAQLDRHIAALQTVEALRAYKEVRGNLPAGIDPVMAPVTTGLGEIYQYYLEGPQAHATDPPLREQLLGGADEPIARVASVLVDIIRPHVSIMHPH